jgi:flagellar basal-body rod protein FlgG
MLAEQLRQDLLANDLANVSTSGYKPDHASQASFGDVLLENTVSGALVGPMNMGTRIATVETDMQQGALRETGEPLDVALEGDGFLAVQTANGIRFTRGGRLVIDAEGRLATATGLPLLGVDSQPIVAGKVSGLTVAADGTVSVDGKAVGQLAIVAVTDARKEGGSLFTGTAAALTDPVAVRQGYLEGSGVDAARVMVDMLISMRTFEAGQRVLRTIDETLGRAVNSAGAVQGS